MIRIDKSNINGYGTFAGVNIKEGQIVDDLTTTGFNRVGYNHSCDPNVKIYGTETIAMKNIQSGDEITVKYNDALIYREGNVMVKTIHGYVRCNCNVCRKIRRLI